MPKHLFKKVAAGVLALVLLIGFLAAFEMIGPGKRGVVIRTGAIQERILGEGFHILVPFVENVKTMDVTVQKYASTTSAASKDLQSVTAEIVLNYHLDPTRVNDIYQEFRNHELETFIDPSIEEAVKSATAQYNAEKLITERALVKDTITADLKSRVEAYGFVVDAVSITDFSFSDAFDNAIEAKVTAEQNALAEKNRLAQIEYEAQQRIVQAQAEAEAIRIQAEAITSQGGAEYVQLQWIEKWNGTLPATMLDGAANVLLGL